MRRATCCLLVVLLASCVSFGQSAPKFTTPRIVATFERLGLTSEMPPITLYTPKNWGTFRISISMVGTVANGNDGFWLGWVQFRNAAGESARAQGPFAAQLFTLTRRSGFAEFPIRAKAGEPIKFGVSSPGGGTDGTKYNVWVVVEQLM